MNVTKKYNINKYIEDELNEKEDLVIVEYPFTIFLNESEFITLLCSPKSLEQLAVGFLHSEGILKSIDDIESIKIDKDNGYGYITTKNKNLLSQKLYGKRTITTGCGKGSIFYSTVDGIKCNKIENKMDINNNNVLNLMKSFNKKSKLFLDTGGVHSVGLCNSDGILLFEEDIGRHNALDKIIGKCLYDNISIKDKIIITSGRITSEVILKCAKIGIPYIVSRSAPTNLAIDIAKDLNIGLIGFVRGNKMNIYF
jgi:FdhD protein